MTFDEHKVYAFLKANGYVYTFRYYPARPPLVRDVRVGGRLTGERVRIEDVPVRGGDHRPFVHGSGFSSWDEWWAAVERRHRSRLSHLCLLKVVLVPTVHNS